MQDLSCRPCNCNVFPSLWSIRILVPHLFDFESCLELIDVNLFVVSGDALELFGHPLEPARVLVQTHAERLCGNNMTTFPWLTDELLWPAVSSCSYVGCFFLLNWQKLMSDFYLSLCWNKESTVCLDSVRLLAESCLEFHASCRG